MRETLSDATFTLENLDGSTAEFGPETTGTDGKIAFYLPSKIIIGYIGTYTLTENNAPSGYVGVGEITLCILCYYSSIRCFQVTLKVFTYDIENTHGGRHEEAKKDF